MPGGDFFARRTLSNLSLSPIANAPIVLVPDPGFFEASVQVFASPVSNAVSPLESNYRWPAHARTLRQFGLRPAQKDSRRAALARGHNKILPYPRASSIPSLENSAYCAGIVSASNTPSAQRITRAMIIMPTNPPVQ